MLDQSARNLGCVFLFFHQLLLSNLLVVNEVIEEEEVDARPKHRHDLDQLKALAALQNFDLVPVFEYWSQEVVKLVVFHHLVLDRNFPRCFVDFDQRLDVD